MTLWQLAVSLAQRRKLDQSNKQGEKSSLGRPAIAVALRSMSHVEAACGHRFAEVVQMCLETASYTKKDAGYNYNDETTCQFALQLLLHYRHDMAQNAASRYVPPPFTKECTLENMVTVVR